MQEEFQWAREFCTREGIDPSMTQVVAAFRFLRIEITGAAPFWLELAGLPPAGILEELPSFSLQLDPSVRLISDNSEAAGKELQDFAERVLPPG